LFWVRPRIKARIFATTASLDETTKNIT